jgi:hypothetical protein
MNTATFDPSAVVEIPAVLDAVAFSTVDSDNTFDALFSLLLGDEGIDATIGVLSKDRFHKISSLALLAAQGHIEEIGHIAELMGEANFHVADPSIVGFNISRQMQLANFVL